MSHTRVIMGGGEQSFGAHCTGCMDGCVDGCMVVAVAACSLFGGRQSDLDLCLEQEDAKRPEKIIRKLAFHLGRQHWCTDLQPILHARVPLVSFKHSPTGLECDLVINNTLAIYNTQLLRT